MISNYEINQDRSPTFYIRQKNDNACPTHFHRKVEILYVTSGTKAVTINNRKRVLTENQIAVSGSYDLHLYEPTADGTQTVLLIPVHRLGNLETFMQEKSLADNFITDENFCKELLPLIECIISPENELILGGAVNLLLGKIVAKIGTRDREVTADSQFTDSVLNYLKTHASNAVTLDSLAKSFGYSKYYFSRLFNSYFGTNINDYLSIIRLEKALAQLNNTDKTVTECAFDSGFNSMQTFYRVYRKNYGNIPLKLKPRR